MTSAAPPRPRRRRRTPPDRHVGRRRARPPVRARRRAGGRRPAGRDRAPRPPPRWVRCRATSARVNGSSSSCGTTWFTKPSRSASAASTKLPVIESSAAFRTPTARGNNAVRPHTATTSSPRVGVGEARPLRRHDERAAQRDLQRPVTHAPLTAHTTGVVAARSVAPGLAAARTAVPAATSLKSTPALNTGSTAVTMIARVPSSASASSIELAEPRPHGGGQRVLDLGPVDRDRPDAVRVLDEEGVVGHLAEMERSRARRAGRRSGIDHRAEMERSRARRAGRRSGIDHQAEIGAEACPEGGTTERNRPSNW